VSFFALSLSLSIYICIHICVSFPLSLSLCTYVHMYIYTCVCAFFLLRNLGVSYTNFGPLSFYLSLGVSLKEQFFIFFSF